MNDVIEIPRDLAEALEKFCANVRGLAMEHGLDDLLRRADELEMKLADELDVPLTDDEVLARAAEITRRRALRK